MHSESGGGDDDDDELVRERGDDSGRDSSSTGQRSPLDICSQPCSSTTNI